VAGSLPEPAVALGVAGACLLAGYLVKYRGWVSLISGVPVVQGAEDVAATTVGNVLLAAGVAVALLAVLLAIGVDRLVPE
jgi:hypothetical protein